MDDTINRAIAAGLSWPVELDDEALEKLLYPPPQPPSSRKLHQPDWQSLHDELTSHKHLTLMLLWQEYTLLLQSGHSYSLLHHGLQKGVPGIGIKLDVDLGRHIVR